MGRKTYESLPFGPLKSRINIVITSTPEKYTGQGKSETVVFCNLSDCEEILKKLQTNTNKRIFIIGGAEIYKYFFSKCETIYVTHVDTDETSGVSIAPLMMELQDRYTVVNRIPSNKSTELNGIRYEFVTYKLQDDVV
jgi:dihydrofolate reductase